MSNRHGLLWLCREEVQVNMVGRTCQVAISRIYFYIKAMVHSSICLLNLHQWYWWKLEGGNLLSACHWRGSVWPGAQLSLGGSGGGGQQQVDMGPLTDWDFFICPGVFEKRDEGGSGSINDCRVCEIKDKRNKWYNQRQQVFLQPGGIFPCQMRKNSQRNHTHEK